MISRQVSMGEFLDRRKEGVDVAGLAGGIVEQDRNRAEIGLDWLGGSGAWRRDRVMSQA